MLSLNFLQQRASHNFLALQWKKIVGPGLQAGYNLDIMYQHLLRAKSMAQHIAKKEIQLSVIILIGIDFIYYR